MTRALVPLLALIVLAPPVRAAEPPAGHGPDPAAVRRHGPAYRYPQAGWVVLHVEGEPYERGYQHGRLMAPELAAMIKSLAAERSTKGPTEAWKHTRSLANALFLRGFDREHLDELKGIADGAAAAGAAFDGRPLDLIDVVTANCWMEIECLDGALEATPHGLEGVRHGGQKKGDHCSAFIATGPATADGKIVFGHITMAGLTSGPHVNVWVDVKPAKGHRFVMQAFPGSIWSSQGYYLNAAGILLAETTIDQTTFDPTGTPLAGRARKAIQYSDSIDDVVKHLTTRNNGLYSNEWLIGDTKTNEIALFELGTHATKLRRSAKDEWFAGTTGFYWGCNNGKDLAVRLESAGSVHGRPADVAWKPSDRDVAWLKRYQSGAGKIDADWGKRALSTPPLAAAISLDAKVTTAALAKDLASHAMYGPPVGRVWHPTPEDRADHPDLRPLVPHPWTVLTINSPPVTDVPPAADIPAKVPETPLTPAERMAPESDPPTQPAWHGTLIPATDADVWLTAGFAAYEKIVELENAYKEKGAGRDSDEGHDRVAVALYEHRAKWYAAKAAAPAEPSTGVAAELDRARRVREQCGLGVLRLHALRVHLGAEKFDAAMDAFGRANAGKGVTAAEFAAAVGKHAGKDAAAFLRDYKPPAEPAFTTLSFLDDLENCVIVYDAVGDGAANKAAAESLQNLIRTRWSNVTVPIRAAHEATKQDLDNGHVLVIGAPPWGGGKTGGVTFGRGSFRLRDEVYAHPDTCVIAAGDHPRNPRYSIVHLVGLSAAATYHAPAFLLMKDTPAAEVLVCPANGKARPLAVTGR